MRGNWSLQTCQIVVYRVAEHVEVVGVVVWR